MILKIIETFLDSSSIQQFFVQGGRHAVDGMLSKVATTCKTSSKLSEVDEKFIVWCVRTWGIMSACIFRNNEEVQTGMLSGEIPYEWVAYSVEKAQLLMQAWYYILRYFSQWDEKGTLLFVHQHIMRAVKLCEDLLACEIQEERIISTWVDIFQFSGALPGDADTPNPTFVHLILKVAREKKSESDYAFLTVARMYPPLLELVEEQVGKLEFCAHPECEVSNLLHGQLKRCALCMEVMYCGREHQVAHWKAGHKQDCQRRIIGADAATAELPSAPANGTQI